MVFEVCYDLSRLKMCVNQSGRWQSKDAGLTAASETEREWVCNGTVTVMNESLLHRSPKARVLNYISHINWQNGLYALYCFTVNVAQKKAHKTN